LSNQNHGLLGHVGRLTSGNVVKMANMANFSNGHLALANLKNGKEGTAMGHDGTPDAAGCRIRGDSRDPRLDRVAPPPEEWNLDETVALILAISESKRQLYAAALIHDCRAWKLAMARIDDPQESVS
jgi:hypothetical protein